MKKILLLTLFGFSLQGMNTGKIKQKPIKSRLKKHDFVGLGRYARNYLADNFGTLACQKNESGFVRYTIPAPKDVQDIEKIRLNFWHEKFNIDPETVHNHPRYFESFIVKGGYQHDLYEKDGLTAEEYDNYRIFKDKKNNKNMMYIGPTHLENIASETTKTGDIVTFPDTMIHRVIKTDPKSLSLNVVFKDAQEEPFYDVFLAKGATMKKVKIQRPVIVGEEAHQITADAIKILDGFIKKNG